MIQNRNQYNLLCVIVCDCMVYPDPKFLIFKTKKCSHFFSEAGGWFFFTPMLSRKTFATNSLKQTFVLDVQLNLCQTELLFRYVFHKGAFTYDVRCFLGIFDLPTYPHQILYYISLFSKIRWGLTYLPTPKSDVICECSLTWHEIVCWFLKIYQDLPVLAYGCS